MKRIFYLIVGLLLVIPFTVKADMSAPEIKELEVTPKSSSGATIYSFGNYEEIGKLKSGETLKISTENEVKGVIYGCSYEDEKCVKMSEVKNADKNVKSKEDKAIYVGRVFAKDGAELYEGPSYAYSKTGDTIPYNAEVRIADLSRGVGTWVYVEYNDISGYVDTATSPIGQLFKNKIIITENNKEYEEYYESNGWDRSLYAKDGDTYKKYSTYDLADVFQYTDKFVLETDAKLYKFAEAGENEQSNKSTVGTLKKGTKVEILYSYYDYGYSAHYVTDGNSKGWLISVEKDDGDYEFPYFDLDYEKLTKNKEYKEFDDQKVLAEEYFKDPDAPTPVKKDDKSEGFKLTPKMIVMLSCAGGALIVLTAIITIIFVNKKKKSVQE